MNIEILNIDDLIEYENNAKEHPKNQIEQIKKSILEFGFNDPIAIDENNVIIEVHGRLYALRDLGYEKVECIRLKHLTDEQKRAYILVHNKLTMNTGFDLELLNIELENIEIDMSDFGFEIEIDNLSSSNDYEEITEDEVYFEVEPKAKYGDIYQLGKHRLMCGDSTNIADVNKLFESEKADLLVTDPPYNVNYEAKEKFLLKYRPNKRVKNGITTIQNDNIKNFRQFLIDVYSNCNRVMKDGASFYIWHASSESYNFIGAAEDIGWKIRQTLVWVKNHFVLSRSDYQNKYEPCLYGWKKGQAHNWYSDRKQTTVLEFNKPMKNIEHPTMKPVELFAYQIQNSSKENDIVYDAFAGSGTTLIACEQTNRICYTMELEPCYVDVIIKRWETLTGEKAIKLN